VQVRNNKAPVLSRKAPVLSNKASVLSNKASVLSNKASVLSNKASVLSNKASVLFNKASVQNACSHEQANPNVHACCMCTLCANAPVQAPLDLRRCMHKLSKQNKSALFGIGALAS